MLNYQNEIIDGSGIVYKMEDDVYYDNTKNIICIGNPDSPFMNNSKSVKFNDNSVLTFIENDLVAIWIIPIWR